MIFNAVFRLDNDTNESLTLVNTEKNLTITLKLSQVCYVVKNNYSYMMTLTNNDVFNIDYYTYNKLIFFLQNNT